MASRLNILMKMFSISGKDLSELIHVDSTLISKWRSGKRSLKPKSIYVDKIVAHIMERDRSSNYVNICKLLMNDYENILSCSEKEIAIFLKSWLTSKDELNKRDSRFEELKNMDSVDISMFYRFKDNKGRRQAVKFLLDYAIDHSPGLEILSITNEDASWFYEDPDFLMEWSEKNYWLLKNTNQISVIHPVDRTYENTATSMLRWMPLHMTGNSKGYYIPKYTDNTVRFTLFLIRNHLVIFSASSMVYGRNLHTFLTNDPAVLESAYNIMREYFDKSIPIFKRYELKSKEDYLNDLIGVLEAKRTKYFYCSTFLFLPLSKELIKEILLYNNASAAQISKYTELNRLVNMLNLRSTSRYFIKLEEVRKLLEQDNIVLDSFSFIIGRKVLVSKELFIRLIREALNIILCTDDIEVGIVDSNVLDYFKNINILAQENTCVHFFSTELEKPLLLRTTELTVVVAIFEMLEKSWNQIPRLKRNKEFVYKQLKEILDMAESCGSAGNKGEYSPKDDMENCVNLN